MKTRGYLKYFVNDCLRKQGFASNFPSDPFKFDSFDNSCSSKTFDTVSIEK